jgi:hypothetical protein
MQGLMLRLDYCIRRSKVREADMSITQMAHQSRNQVDPGDAKLFVQFYSGNRINKEKTKLSGRPIHDDMTYVRIMSPGNKTSIIDRPARDDDISRFRRQYDSFAAGEGDYVSGTPLEAWPQISRGQVEEMRFFNVRTVEQLADISDTHTKKFMGVVELKKKAKAFLETTREAEPLLRVQAELEERDSRILTLEDALAKQSEMIEQLRVKAGIDDKPSGFFKKLKGGGED